MPKHYRPSIERFNAPFRGTTDKEDDVNFHLALLHDLSHIERVAGGNSNYPGHQQFIDNNFSGLYQGRGEITANLPSAGRLTTRRLDYPNTTPNFWVKIGQATLSKLPQWNSYALKGLLHQSGLIFTIDAQPGDILVIRTSVEATASSVSQFAIGSTNTLDGQPDLTIYDSRKFIGSPKYIEKRLPIETKQSVELVFYATHGTQGVSDLILKDFSVACYNQNTVSINGMDDTIKIELNRLTKHLNSLNDQYTYKKGV